MQPLRLVIPGRFWDTQIYAGRLYAFTEDGDILTLNWDALIDVMPVVPRLRVPFEYAFQRSNLLYLESALRDPDVRTVISNKFKELSQNNLEIGPRELEKSKVSVQPSPFEFPHSDSTIYREDLYVVSETGVFRASCSKARKFGISTKTHKHWDGSIFQVAASYNRLALAAGDDGLFELDINRLNYGRDHLRQITTYRCTGVSWAFHSIYGSAHDSSGFLADFNRERKARPDQADENGRWLRKVIPSEDIFHAHGFSWAAQDRICMSVDGTIKIIDYAPYEEADDQRIRERGSLIIDEPEHGRVLAGAVALFGTIVEYEKFLLVSMSDGKVWKSPKEVVAWRVFPRSRNYENQLHVIYEDRLEILSFNNDYFVDQNDKVSGIRFFDHSSRSNWGFRDAMDTEFSGAPEVNINIFEDVVDEQIRRLPPKPDRKLLPE